MTTSEPLPPCMIFVGKDGQWYHEGAEIIHRPIFLWLIQNMEKDEQGNFIVHLNNQKCILEVEDTPLVVQRVDLVPEEGTGEEIMTLTLNDERQETLDPESLWMNRESVLYCLVKNGRIPARFLRPAYYQIANFIDEDDVGEFFLTLNRKKYRLPIQ
jgi:uncharacterized protein